MRQMDTNHDGKVSSDEFVELVGMFDGRSEAGIKRMRDAAMKVRADARAEALRAFNEAKQKAEAAAKVAADLHYIRHAGYRLDTLIFWRTLVTVVTGRGT